jgi:hypothetical protein
MLKTGSVHTSIVVRNTRDNIMGGTKFSHHLQFYMFLKEYFTVYVFLKKKDKQQSTKHIHKTKDRVTLQTGGKECKVLPVL